MLSGEKILVTGVTGAVTSWPIAKSLASENEVWGVARFSDPEARGRVEASGIRVHPVDLAQGELSGLPDDFTVVLHFAHARMGEGEFIEAIQANAVGAGLVLQHCRKARAALVISSAAIYSTRPDDPMHLFSEGDDIGRSYTPWAPTSPASKVSLEAVARFCAEAFSLPVTIARISTAYGPAGGMPIMDMDSVVAGKTVHTWSDPYPHSPIHTDDLIEQVEPLLHAASAPANIVNWCGDEVVTQREWCVQAGELAGAEVDLQLTPIPGAQQGGAANPDHRRSITGPCRRVFRESFQEIFHERHSPV
ncbi:NAD(P)-dependent oxidoreductase [Myxococcota bacterium]|nr:NAD(P)-dependent oxidoreductase [Myxococcota bacterium]